MNEAHEDASSARSRALSDYLDGELGADERAALEARLAEDADARALLAELRRVRDAARALGPAAPARDLWPGIAARIGAAERDRSRRTWTRAIAAGVAGIALGIALGAELGGRGAEPAAGPRFLLLLHSDGRGAQLPLAEQQEIVASYRAWSRELQRRGQLDAGAKLGGDGWILAADGERPRAESGGIGGYFVLRATSYDEALRLARTCPHLERGEIELRRIADT